MSTSGYRYRYNSRPFPSNQPSKQLYFLVDLLMISNTGLEIGLHTTGFSD